MSEQGGKSQTAEGDSGQKKKKKSKAGKGISEKKEKADVDGTEASEENGADDSKLHTKKDKSKKSKRNLTAESATTEQLPTASEASAVDKPAKPSSKKGTSKKKGAEQSDGGDGKPPSESSLHKPPIHPKSKKKSTKKLKSETSTKKTKLEDGSQEKKKTPKKGSAVKKAKKKSSTSKGSQGSGSQSSTHNNPTAEGGKKEHANKDTNVELEASIHLSEDDSPRSKKKQAISDEDLHGMSSEMGESGWSSTYDESTEEFGTGSSHLAKNGNITNDETQKPSSQSSPQDQQQQQSTSSPLPTKRTTKPQRSSSKRLQASLSARSLMSGASEVSNTGWSDTDDSSSEEEHERDHQQSSFHFDVQALLSATPAALATMVRDDSNVAEEDPPDIVPAAAETSNIKTEDDADYEGSHTDKVKGANEDDANEDEANEDEETGLSRVVNSTEEQAPGTSKNEKEEQPPRRKPWIIWGAVGFVLVVVILIVVLIVVTRGDGEGDTQKAPSASPKGDPNEFTYDDVLLIAPGEVAQNMAPVSYDCSLGNHDSEGFAHVVDQCRCNNEVSILPEDVLSMRQLLVERLLPLVNGDSNKYLQQESLCDPVNMALVWLASGDNRDSGIIRQRYALAVLFFALDGSNWDVANNWLTDTNECDWSGVECNSWGVLTSISLDSNNMVGMVRQTMAIARLHVSFDEIDPIFKPMYLFLLC